MPQTLHLDTDLLRQFLCDYLDQVHTPNAAQIKATAYVLYEARIKPILIVTQRNKQNTANFPSANWSLPKDHLYQAMQSGSTARSPDTRSICIPIFPPGNLTAEPIGLLVVTSTA